MEAKPNAGTWISVATIVLAVVVLCIIFKRSMNSSSPVLLRNPPVTQPAPVNSPPGTPREELAPALLYEEHRDDLSLPDNAEVERHTDGYSYLKAFTDFFNRPNRSAE